jgi:hypothetical protein
MFHQVTRAIMPDFSLREALSNWPAISLDLAESRRRRRRQLEKWPKTS